MGNFNFSDVDGVDPIGFYDQSSRVPLPTDIKLYRTIPHEYVDYSIPPTDIDFVTGLGSTKLYAVNSIIVFGEIRRIDYYLYAIPNQYGGWDYSDLMVREDFVYTRDANGFAQYRAKNISWFREDDTAHPTVKTIPKAYDLITTMEEGVKRRGLCVTKLMTEVSYLLIQTQTQLATDQERLQLGRDFISLHKSTMDMMIQASDQSVLTEITNDVTTAWLDDVIDGNGTTFRQYIYASLNLWGV